MGNIFTSFLLAYKKKIITLEELEAVSHQKKLPYEQFANDILNLEEEGILTMVKSRGRTIKKPALAYSYRIQASKLKEELFIKIQNARFELHEQIDLDPYFGLEPNQFESDLPYLKKISAYLDRSGLPTEPVPAPERSFALVGDEKWVTEGSGEDCLKRIKLWEAMKIIPIADPLMIAIDGKKASALKHYHLVVENKTTFEGLVHALRDSIFTCLIYGSGRKVVKGMEHFHQQVLLEGEHVFYYFGDLDAEGIAIWHSLTQRVPVRPAIPFYVSCLHYPSVYGKTNQRHVAEALESFSVHFSSADQTKITNLLKNGHYLPQEVLKTKELQAIWRHWRETD